MSCDFENKNNTVFIQGGGTLDDWANLSKYAESNKELIDDLDLLKSVPGRSTIV